MWQQKSSFDCIKGVEFFFNICTMYNVHGIPKQLLTQHLGLCLDPRCFGQSGPNGGGGQFGTRTIGHQDIKIGQFGTKILKTDNLAPRQENGQFSTRQFGTGKFLYFCICIFVICILFKRNHLTLSFFIPYLCPTGHTNTPKLNLCPRCCQKCFIKFNLVV